jgi:hypothetical protein
MRLFHIHARHNPVYRGFLAGLGVRPNGVQNVERIPCLPIGLFRRSPVLLDGLRPKLSFVSSGTTGAATSTHHVAFPQVYEQAFSNGFHVRYGPPSGWRIVALLPAYAERPDSSLVYMVQRLVKATGDAHSGCYLYEYDQVARLLEQSEAEGQPTLLIGVTFALLDLAEQYPQPLRHTTVVETGGMKGRRPELVREALHERLQRAFGVATVHSEYGMTELLSQAWSSGNGVFHCPPWMRVLAREVNDPLHRAAPGRTGGLDVIDLANMGSCPFIATQDLGQVAQDGSFTVLGRFDHSDVRGCNLLVEG